MSQVDERVAKITFDNDAFEKRAATSLDTINKINEAMQFKGQKNSFDALTKMANTLSSSTLEISDSVSTLQGRFSSLGIVGMETIRSITNGLLNLGKTLVNKVYDPIVNGGKNRALNLEQARFMLNGLMGDAKDAAKKVENILNGPVNDAVSGTRFGLDEAAVAASNLYASGITDNNDLTKSLQAISGAASMANREFGDMAQIFATVKSNGKLMTMQVRQFASMGMNVGATLKDWYEKEKGIVYTEEQIVGDKGLISQGKVAYEDFVNAMYKYWPQAAKANDTFAGAAANLRAALARIGAEFQSKNLVQMRKWFNSLMPVINYIKSNVGPLVDMYDKHMGKMRNGIMGLFVTGTEKKGFIVLTEFKNLVEALMGVISSLGAVVSHTVDNVSTFVDSMVPSGGFQAAADGLNRLKDIIDSFMAPENSVQAKIFGMSVDEIKENADAINKELENTKKKRDLYMTNMITYDKDYKETTDKLTAARERLEKLEEKYDKKPTDKLAKKITLQRQYIAGLEKNEDALKKNFEQSEAGYKAYKEQFTQLKKLNGDLTKTPLDEFLRSIATTLSHIGTLASEVVKPISNRKTTIVSTLKSIAGWLADTQYAIEGLFRRLTKDVKFMEDLRRIGRGFYSVFHIILQLINAIAKAVSKVPGKLRNPIKTFTSFLAGIGDWIYEADKFIEKNDLFTKAIDKIAKFLSPFIKVFQIAAYNVKMFFESFLTDGISFEDIITGIVNAINGFKESVDEMGSVVGGIKDIFGKVVEKLREFSPVFDAIASVFDSIFGVIKKIFQNTKDEMSGWTLFDLLNGVLGLINAEAISLSIGLFHKIVQGFSDFSSSLSIMVRNVNETLRELGKTLEVWQRSLKADTILKISIAVGILALSLISLANVPTKDMWKAIGAIAALATILMAAFAAFEKLNTSRLDAIGKDGSLTQFMTKTLSRYVNAGQKVVDSMVLIEIAAAVLILAEAVKVLAKAAENPGAMWQGVAAVGALMAMLWAFQKFSGESKLGPGVGLGLVLMAASLKIIASVISDLSDLIKVDPIAVQGSIKAIGVVLLELAIFMGILETAEISGAKMLAIGASMILIGAAMKIIANVLSDISDMASTDPRSLQNAIKGLGIVLLELTLFMNSLEAGEVSGGKMLAISASMILIGAALEIITDVIKKLAIMTAFNPWNVLNALLVMGLVFAEIGGLFALMSMTKLDGATVLAFSASIILLGVAMEILADVVGKLSVLWSTDWQSCIFALLMIASLLTIFGTFTNLTGEMDLATTAGALLIFSAALLVMAGALQTVGSMEIGQIVAAFASLALLIVVFGTLSAAMTVLSEVLIPGAAVMLAMAGALLMFAAALSLTTSAIVKFSKLGTSDIEQFFENLKNSMKHWQEILPEILTFVGGIIVGVIQVIASRGIEIATAVTKLLISILTLVRDNIGQITSLVLEIFTAFIRAVGDNIDDIVAAGLYVIEQFLKGIAEGVPGLITAAVDVIVAFIDGITNNLQRVIAAGTNLIITLMWGIALQNALIIQTAKDIMSWFLDEIGATDVFEAGANVVQGFIDGINSLMADIKTVAGNIATTTLDTLKSLLGIHSPSKETEKLGIFTVEGANKGVKEAKPKFLDTIANLVADTNAEFGEVSKATSIYADEVDKADKETKKVTNSVKTLHRVVKQVETEADKRGKLIAQAFRNGVLEAKGTVDEAGKMLGTAFSYSFKSVAGNTKEYKSYVKGLKKDIKSFITSSELTKYANLGNKLYFKSDAFKQSLKELKGYLTEYRKKLKEIEESRKTKKGYAGSDEEKRDLKNLDEIDSKIKKIGKSFAKGPGKAIKAFRKELKETVKQFLAFSNISLNNVLDYQSKIKIATRTDALISGLSGTLKATVDAAKATSDQFDVMNTSTETGINLLERFQKVSTVSARRLLVNAKSQIKAFEEFQNGIQKLRESGLDSEFVDELEAQGPQALGTIRGFGKMTAEEIAVYNQLIEKKREYESKQLEKNLQKKEELYEEYYADIEELAARGLSEGIIKRLKEAGIEQSTFVKALLNLNDAKIESVNDFYERSVLAADNIERIRNSEETFAQTYDSFSEMLEGQVKQKDAWTSMIKQLRKAGIDSELIQTFKDMGYESGHEYVEQIIKEIKTPGAVEKINSAIQKLRDETDDPGTVWLKNMKTSRKSYEQYEKDMEELANTLPKGEDDPVYKYVKSLGWEDGAQYAEAFINSSAENQTKLRNELKRQQKINRQQIAEQLEDRITSVENWQKNLDKISKKKYTSGKKKGQNIIPDDMMAELVAMGPEAAEEIEAIASMGETEFKELCKKWSKASELSDDVAKAVTKSYARTAGDAVKVFSDTVSGSDAKNKLTTNVTNALTASASSVKPTAEKKGKSVGKAAKDGVKSYVNKTNGEKLATQMCEGLAKGFEDNTSLVKTAAKQVAKQAYKAMKKALDINSPSGLTQELGMYLDLGLAKGMKDNVDEVVGGMDYIRDRLALAASTIVDTIQNGSQIDYGINIVPNNAILDLSGNVAQASQIQDIFSSISGIDFEIGRDANREVVDELKRQSDRQVIFADELRAMHEDIMQMQLVMDSGALVGQIANPMNTALGERIALAQRGVTA